MVLTTAQREEVWEDLMIFWSDREITVSLAKLDLRAAIFAVDDEIEAVMGTFATNDEVSTTNLETWFPSESRQGPNELTPDQKLTVITRITIKRLLITVGE